MRQAPILQGLSAYSGHVLLRKGATAPKAHPMCCFAVRTHETLRLGLSDSQHLCYATAESAVLSRFVCRLINVHVISMLGVPEEQMQPCIECWCQDATLVAKGKLGGGACCNATLCPSTVPQTTLTTYLLQYNVSYRSVIAVYGCPHRPCILTSL